MIVTCVVKLSSKIISLRPRHMSYSKLSDTCIRGTMSAQCECVEPNAARALHMCADAIFRRAIFYNCQAAAELLTFGNIKSRTLFFFMLVRRVKFCCIKHLIRQRLPEKCASVTTVPALCIHHAIKPPYYATMSLQVLSRRVVLFIMATALLIATVVNADKSTCKGKHCKVPKEPGYKETKTCVPINGDCVNSSVCCQGFCNAYHICSYGTCQKRGVKFEQSDNPCTANNLPVEVDE